MFGRRKHHEPAAAPQWEHVTGNIVDLQLLPKLTGPGQQHWPSPKRYTVLLHPEGREAYRATIDVHPIDHPDDLFFAQPGAVTGFLVDPASGQVQFDMADRRNSMKAHQTDASLVENEVLSGVVAPRGEAVTGPPWVVPAECPGCGAAVDQATAAMDLAPRCAFCHQPLPAEPRARF